MKRCGFGFLVLFSCLATVVSLLSPLGVNYEVLALIGIRESLEDPHGVLDNWDSNSVDPCSWTIVTCSPDNLVIGLGTPSQNLSGTLSPSIGNLTNLQSVLLQNNNISGKLPPEIGKLAHLRTLDLSNNFLTGEIPSSLGDLKQLEYLRLNNNSLSGKLPQSLANISKLTFLDLSYNNLTGPVPSFSAVTFSIVGNSLICSNTTERGCVGAVPAPFSSSLQNFTNPVSNQESRTGRFAIALGLSLGGAALLILIIALILVQWQRSKQPDFFDMNEEQNLGEEACLGNLRRFSLRELLAATDNFSDKNIVGKGGFGIVYRGVLRDGAVVAVKRLRDGDAAGGELQFQTEVEMISLAVHRNVLRLYGYCAAAAERILVYPFMPNGSLANRLKGKPPLEWAARKRIAVGAARGLAYLHEQCDPKIIHRDVKAANILLDAAMEAVVGDLGLAKLLDHAAPHVSTAVRGTAGHIPPEYLSTGHSSDKTDVYAFGILLLELVSAVPALDFFKSHNKGGAIADWAAKLRAQARLGELVDPALTAWDAAEVDGLVRVALVCAQPEPAKRPRMAEVVRMLEGEVVPGEGIAAQRWEAAGSARAAHELSSSDRFSDLTDDSLQLVQPIELSGPR
ncbi:protein NSP-INTERACTING KINASE 1-like [Wolffia australiana]